MKDVWFGGVNVHYSSLVTVCSFHQSMMELSLSVSAITNKLGCMTSVNIWQICVDYNELTSNECQKEYQMFSSMLDAVVVSLTKPL